MAFLPAVFSLRRRTVVSAHLVIPLGERTIQCREYAYCLRTLDTWFEQEQVLPENLRENAWFMYAASSYELNRTESSLLLKNLSENSLVRSGFQSLLYAGINRYERPSVPDVLAFFFLAAARIF